MSYSFSARGATREAVLKSVAEKLDEVLVAQPMHKADRDQAYNAVEWYLHIVPESADKDYSVSVNGSIGWTGEDDAKVITGAGVGVSVSLVDKAV